MGSCFSSGISATAKGSPVSYKIVLVGDSGVGKSSVFLRYTKNQFDYQYVPTMSVCIESMVKLCLPSHQQSHGGHAAIHTGKKQPQAVVVSLWDLPGKDEVDLRKTYYRNLDAVIVVVELEPDLNTESATRWRQDILDNLNDELVNNAASIPFLLLGSKLDKVLKETEKAAAIKRLQEFAFKNDFIAGVPVSTSSGDGSVHKAIQLLVQFMIEKTFGLHKSVVTDTMREAVAAELNAHSLALTDNQEVDMATAQCAKQLTTAEQQYEIFQKGLVKFRQHCVVAGITSASLSSIEQCVLALRSSLIVDKEILLYKMDDGFPELYINHDSDSTSTLPMDLSYLISLYRSQVYMNGKQLLSSLPAVLKACSSCLEQLITRAQANVDYSGASLENVTEARRTKENQALHSNKEVLEQRQAAINQWLGKVQGCSEKVVASMLWEDTDVT